MIGFDSPEVRDEMLEEFAAAARRAWEAIKRIIAETLNAIVRWVKCHYRIVRAVYRSLGYRPDTVMRKKLRRAFVVVRR